MNYQFWIKNEAKAEIKRLPGHMRQRVRKAIRKLATEPRPYNSIELTVPVEIDLEVRRLQLDRWRVIYVIDEEWSEVGALAVRKRPPYDYQDLLDLLKGLY